jgi:hypothetical protein
MIEDPSQPELVREGLKKILESFLNNEYNRLQRQVFDGETTGGHFGSN